MARGLEVFQHLFAAAVELCGDLVTRRNRTAGLVQRLTEFQNRCARRCLVPMKKHHGIAKIALV